MDWRETVKVRCRAMRKLVLVEREKESVRFLTARSPGSRHSGAQLHAHLFTQMAWSASLSHRLPSQKPSGLWSPVQTGPLCVLSWPRAVQLPFLPTALQRLGLLFASQNRPTHAHSGSWYQPLPLPLSHSSPGLACLAFSFPKTRSLP